MDISDVQAAYKASDAGKFSPDRFATTSLAYALQEPGAAREAAQLYHQLGRELVECRPVGNAEYVAGLFDMALRQPPHSQVSRSAALAIGMSVIPDDELGKALPEERYLMLHGAAQLAQTFAGDLARSFVADHRQAKRQVPHIVWIVILGVVVLLVLTNS